MAEQTIKYTLEVENKSGKTFDDVKQATKEQESRFKSLTQASKEFGAAVGKGIKDQFKGIGEELEKVTKKHHNFFGGIIGKLADLAISAVKAQLAMAAVGLVLGNIGKISETVGKTFPALGKGIATVGDFLASAWTKVGTAADKGRDAIVKQFPALERLVDLFKAVRVSYDAFAAGMTGKKLAFVDSLEDSKAKSSVSFSDKGNAIILENLNKRAKNAAEGFHKLGAAINTTTGPFQSFIKNANGAASMFGKVLSFLAPAANGFAKVLSTMFRYPVAFGAAVAAVVGLIVAFKDIKKTIDELDSLGDHSAIVGFTASAYKAWDHQLKLNGTSMQEMEQVITSLSANILDAASNTGKFAKVFKELGVKAVDNQGYLKSNQEVFTEVITKLSSMEDKALRNAYALEIFGNRGRQLIPLLNGTQGSIEQVNKAAEKNAKLFLTATTASDRYNDTLENIKNSFDIAKTKVYTAIIQRLADTLEIISNSQVGEVFGVIFTGLAQIASVAIDIINTIGAAIDAIYSGLSTIVKAALTSIYTAYYEVANFLNDKPLIGHLISDAHVAESKQKMEAITNATIESFNKMVNAGKMAGKSFMQIGSLGQILPEGSVDDGGKTKPPPRDDKTQEKLKSILDKFNQWRIQSIKDSYVRERETIKQEYKSRLVEIQTAEKEGVITSKQAADAKISIAVWKKNEILRIEQEEYQARQELYINAHKDALAELNDSYEKELAILAKFNTQRIANIPNLTMRGRAELEVEYNQRTTENTAIMNSGEPGMYEAAKSNQLEIDKWYEDEKRKLSIQGTQAYLDRLQYVHEQEKKNIIANLNVYKTTLSAVSNNYNLLVDVIKASSEENTIAFENWSTGLTAVNDSMSVIIENFGNTANTIAGVASAVNNAIVSITQNSNQAAINSLNKWYENEKEKISNSVSGHRRRQRELLKLEEEKAKKEDQIRRENFEKTKIASILQATINTAVAITQAFAQLGPVGGAIMAGVIAALGIAQIAIIASQKYARGGIVPGTGNQDTVTAKLTPGEMVLNKQQQANLFAIANGRKPSSVQPVTISTGDIVINGNVDEATLAKLDEKNIENQIAIKRMLKELQFQGELSFLGAA